MNTIQRRLHGRWGVPATSGSLIVASLAATHLFGAPTVGSGLMLSAAVVAGLPIAAKAIRSLLAKLVSIDLLVTVAAVGALIVGDFWEAATVTSRSMLTSLASRERIAFAAMGNPATTAADSMRPLPTVGAPNR